MKYDDQNVFAKIIQKEINSTILYEDEDNLAFQDANPVAPTHILVIPKGAYIDYSHFIESATPEQIGSFFGAVANVIKNFNLNDYRLITNKGPLSGQSVYHFHIHIISGKQLKGLIAND